jgi:predicted dehydrogenase
MRGLFNNKQNDHDDIRHKPDMGGGSLWDTGSYAVNFMRTMMGAEPVQVHAWQVTGVTGVDTVFMAHMRFESGVLAQFQCGFDALPYTEADIIGSTGMIRLDLPWVNQPGENANIRISRMGTEPGAGSYGDSSAGNQTETLTYKDVEPYGDQVKAVVATILDGAPQVISDKDSLNNIAAIVALYESARTGNVVTL